MGLKDLLSRTRSPEEINAIEIKINLYQARYQDLEAIGNQVMLACASLTEC